MIPDGAARPALPVAEVRKLFRAIRGDSQNPSVPPFGIPTVDAALPNKGRPLGAVHEFLRARLLRGERCPIRCRNPRAKERSYPVVPRLPRSIRARVGAHRLGTDYVDLYQIHRWDYETPIEETLEALSDVVKAGKARYVGASSMHAWQFMKALGLQRQHGWAPFVSMQNHLNLLYREEEREMLPLCRSEGIGVVSWSPLARGRLARPWQDEPTTARAATDEVGRGFYDKSKSADRAVVERVGVIAAQRGVSRAQIALAWLLHKDGVTAPIVGATKMAQLNDALSAITLSLSQTDIAALEEPYVPHEVSGFA